MWLCFNAMSNEDIYDDETLEWCVQVRGDFML